MLFNLLTVLFYNIIFLLFWTIDLYFLIPTVIAEAFNPIAKLAISIGVPSKEAMEMETHPIFAEAQIKKCSILLIVVQTFLCFLLINSFRFISSIS